jgi:predicted ArsR family transcriptional regulator
MGYRLIESPDPYKWLAALLAESVREGRSALETGRVHGRRATPSPQGPSETIRAEAERLGFRPEVKRGRGGRIELVLQECPFADVASADPATVCALHRGLAEGVASITGDLQVESLVVADPHQGGCRLVMRAT